MGRWATLLFESSGLLTTIQDQGRSGHQHMGVPSGGALDRRAARAANSLVGNDAGAPVLEITINGPSIRFDECPCVIALTGGDISPSVDGTPIGQNEPVEISPGQVLKFGRLRRGCRAYMAVGGKWQVDSWLGSSSAFLQDSIHILPDHVIRKGQILAVDTTNQTSRPDIDMVKAGHAAEREDEIVIRVIPGPEYRHLGRAAIESFLRMRHRASNDCSRMGIRLAEPLQGVDNLEGLISSAVIPGTIQLTPSGQCIILLNDAQTTGGYYRIANVISADIDTLAQVKPGDALRFELLNIDQIRNI